MKIYLVYCTHLVLQTAEFHGASRRNLTSSRLASTLGTCGNEKEVKCGILYLIIRVMLDHNNSTMEPAFITINVNI